MKYNLYHNLLKLKFNISTKCKKSYKNKIFFYQNYTYKKLFTSLSVRVFVYYTFLHTPENKKGQEMINIFIKKRCFLLEEMY